MSRAAWRSGARRGRGVRCRERRIPRDRWAAVGRVGRRPDPVRPERAGGRASGGEREQPRAEGGLPHAAGHLIALLTDPTARQVSWRSGARVWRKMKIVSLPIRAGIVTAMRSMAPGANRRSNRRTRRTAALARRCSLLRRHDRPSQLTFTPAPLGAWTVSRST